MHGLKLHSHLQCLPLDFVMYAYIEYNFPPQLMLSHADCHAQMSSVIYSCCVFAFYTNLCIYIQFLFSELNAVIQAINGSKVKNCNINCEVVNMCEHLPFTTPREILVSGIPSGFTVGYVEAYVEQTTGMKPGADFTLTQHFDTSLLIMLKKSYNMQGNLCLATFYDSAN